MAIGPFSPRIQGSGGAAAPSSAGRLSNIDALRGSAAVAVAISHIYQQFYAEQFGPVLHKILSYAGGWGVALFFVLSGFCIHLPHAERKRFAAKVGGVAKLNVADFAIQRFLRIIPPYWLSLGLSLAAGAIATTNILNGSTYWGDVLVHILGIHGFFPNCLESINSVFWTIGLEIHFYILYIFFANRVFNLYRVAALMACGLFVYGAFSVSLQPNDPWRLLGTHLFVTLFWQWYLGAWLAEIYVKYKARFVGPSIAVYAMRVAVIILSFSMSLIDPVVFKLHIVQWTIPFVSFSIVALFLIDCRTTGGLFSDCLSHLGDVSYSLYLLHPLAIWVFVALPSKSSSASIWQGVLSLIVSILFAAISYHLVERPLLRWRKSLRNARRSPATERVGGASAEKSVATP
jgi:peptidoglycan/LPS O-acetylase OafA/YrhL